MYDFYSDTKSIPTNAMLESIVSAPLGDEQKGEDPTTKKLEARIAKGYPLRKLGVPEDIGKVVAFLAGDGASHTTGQTISVSGGYTMA